jgi:hypothetical protein
MRQQILSSHSSYFSEFYKSYHFFYMLGQEPGVAIPPDRRANVTLVLARNLFGFCSSKDGGLRRSGSEFFRSTLDVGALVV